MVEVIHLKKSYAEQVALHGISFNIKEGEFYGLLGPNGAGKTTTISILSSIQIPDEGKVWIDGIEIHRNKKATQRIMGVVPQEIALYNDLSALENLMFWGGLYKIPHSALTNRANELLRLLGLYERRHDRVGAYSGGMKRRINIAAALLHHPKILFLDEPTVGIDPHSRHLIYEVIEQLHKEGMTFIYTTHYMEEAERLCDRIGIIDEGKIIAEGTLDALKQSSRLKDSIAITYSQISEDQVNQLQQLWSHQQQTGNTIHFYSSAVQHDLPTLVSASTQAGAEIAQVDIQKVNLQHIFLQLTGKQLRD